MVAHVLCQGKPEDGKSIASMHPVLGALGALPERVRVLSLSVVVLVGNIKALSSTKRYVGLAACAFLPRMCP